MNYSESKLALWKYSKGVGFDESSHTYYYKNRTLTSVTTAVSNCFPKFDKGGNISIELAEKRGISVKALKKEWSDKADMGSVVHNELEKYVLDIENYFYNGDSSWVDKRCHQGYLFLFEYAIIKPLFTEFPVYNGKYSIAGTCDLLVFNESTGKIDIYDWKTNDEIVKENVNFKKFGYGSLSHIPDTNFWKYALQLSIYKYLLEQAGFEVGDLKLVHLKEDSYEVIKLPYLSDESLIVLESNL